MSARLMQTGAGTIALVAGGVIIIAMGGYHVYRGPAATFSTTSRAIPATWCDDWAWWATSLKA
jgi:hypothetical protein